MTGLEIYTHVNETVGIIIWPCLILVFVLIFKSTLRKLIERAAGVEGKIGDFSFKLSLEKMMQDKVKEAVELEKQGKTEEVQKLISSTSELATRLYGLSNSDVDELLLMASGGESKRKWGKPHLVRAGLVELKGNKLTPQGKVFVNKYLGK